MSFVLKERCPDCGRTFKNLSNHKICHSRGSGKHANKLSVVQRQVCPDCGRDFVDLANHKVCHGRGSASQQGHRNIPPATSPPSRREIPTPAPTPHPSNRERPAPSHTPSPSNRERQTPASTPRPSNIVRQTPGSTPHRSNRERPTPAPTPHPSNRERLSPSPTPPSFSRERRPPVPPSQTERQTPPPLSLPYQGEEPTPPFYGLFSYIEGLTPPPTPPPLHREEPTPPIYTPLSHVDRRTPSPTAPLYPSIPTYTPQDENNHQSHQQYRQPHQQPQHPFRQREHQQRGHTDYRPRLNGRLSSLWEGQQHSRGHNLYNGSLSDEDALAVAIAASQDPEEANLGRSFSNRNEPDINVVPTGSQHLVREHRSRCMEFGASGISVNRDSVWSSSMAFFKDIRISDRAKQLMVTFTDSEDRREEGVDTGGPRREYLRLLLESMVANSKMLHGDENQGFQIRPNISAYSKKHFRVMGVMLATMIAQGGQPPAIFAPPVVDAILDQEALPSMDYVPDTRTRESLKKVSEARDATELEEALEECDWRYDLDGIPSHVTMASRDEFLRGCVQYFVILQSKPMLDQMIEGLRHCGILDLIRRDTLRDLLEYKSDVNVTAERVMDLLKPDECCHSNEHQILDNLSRFLQAAEDGSLCDKLAESQRLTRSQTEFAGGITPGRLLAFVTGCSREPAGGFVPKPSIAFNYSATWRLPSASTCSNQILITVHQNSLEFHSFCQAMLTSMMNGENFTTA